MVGTGKKHAVCYSAPSCDPRPLTGSISVARSGTVLAPLGAVPPGVDRQATVAEARRKLARCASKCDTGGKGGLVWRPRRFALGGGLRPGHGETPPKDALEARPKRQPERATAALFERNRQPAVEATFRSLKSEISLRPIRHTQRDRIRAHFCIAVLAYHAVHVPSRRPDSRGRHDSRTTIRRKPAGWVRLMTTLETAAGRRVAETGCRRRPSTARWGGGWVPAPPPLLCLADG